MSLGALLYILSLYYVSVCCGSLMTYDTIGDRWLPCTERINYSRCCQQYYDSTIEKFFLSLSESQSAALLHSEVLAGSGRDLSPPLTRPPGGRCAGDEQVHRPFRHGNQQSGQAEAGMADQVSLATSLTGQQRT